jgi:hypothetical protein
MIKRLLNRRVFNMAYIQPNRRASIQHSKPNMMLLEPRFMFDGAAGETVAEVLLDVSSLVSRVDGLEEVYTPPAHEEPAATVDVEGDGGLSQASEDALYRLDGDTEGLDEAVAMAEQMIRDYLSEADAKDLFRLFHGGQAEAPEGWLEAAEALRQSVLNGEYSVVVRLVGAAELGNTGAAFAAVGPDGVPTILVNRDWLEAQRNRFGLRAFWWKRWGTAWIMP